MSLYQALVHQQLPLTTSQIQTFQIPSGAKIQSCCLLFYTSAGAVVTEAQVRAEIGNIRLTMGGKDIVNADVNTILDFYEALGVHVASPTAVPGAVELNLGRLLFIDPRARDLVGWGTADQPSIQVSITVGTLSAIASAQVLTERQIVAENLGVHTRFITYTQSGASGTGLITVSTLPRDTDSAYLALMVGFGAGTISQGQVIANTQNVVELATRSAINLFGSNKGYATVTGYLNHFFTDGTSDARLNMNGITDLRIVNNFTASATAGYGITPVTLNGLTVK